MLLEQLLDLIKPHFNLENAVFGVREHKLADRLKIQNILDFQLDEIFLLVIHGEKLFVVQDEIFYIRKLLRKLEIFENNLVVFGRVGCAFDELHIFSPLYMLY